MRVKWQNRLVSILLVFVLVIGALPPVRAGAYGGEEGSAAEGTVSMLPEDTAGEGSGEDASAASAGEEAVPALDEQLSSESTVAPLPTTSTGEWTNRPDLSVRVLKGDGSDVSAEYQMQDLGYFTNSLEPFTLQIELSFFPGHEDPVLTIDSTALNYELFHISSYTDPSVLSAGTVEAFKVGSFTRKLVYHLKPADSGTAKVSLNVSFEPRMSPYPAIEWPVSLAFTALEGGKPASVFVQPSASAVKCKDVPQDDFLTDAAYSMDPVSVQTTKAALQNGESWEMKFSVFNNIQTAFSEDTPILSAMDLRLKPLASGLKIIGAKSSYSATAALKVTEEDDGTFLIHDIPVIYSPDSKSQFQLQLQLQKSDAEYGKEYGLQMTGLTVIGSRNERKYEQKIPPADRTLTIKTLKAPASGVLTLTDSSSPANRELWYNSNGDLDEGGQKYTQQAVYHSLGTVFGPEAEEAEKVYYTDLSVELDLPKGLAPGVQIGASKPSLLFEFLREGETEWQDGEKYTERSSTIAKFKVPGAEAGKNPVTKVRITAPKGTEQPKEFYFYLDRAWAATPDRNGAPLSNGQTETLSVVARGTLPDGSTDTVENHPTVTYKEYNALKAVNCIDFTGTTKTGATSAYWDICTPRGVRRPEADKNLPDLPCYTGRDWCVRGAVLITNAATASGTRPIPQTNMVFELKPEPGVELVKVEGVSVNGAQMAANAKEVFGDPNAKVEITLSDDSVLQKTLSELPYTASAGFSIRRVRYTFPKQLTAVIMRPTSSSSYTQQDYSPMFFYGFNVDPDSEVAQAEKTAYKYVTLSFLGSEEVPAQTDGTPYGSFTAQRTVPVVVPEFTSPGPYKFSLNLTKPVSGSTSVGKQLTITTGASATRDPGWPTVHFNQAAENRSLEGKRYVAYKVNKNFTFINQSQVLGTDSPPVTVSWNREFFDDGDSLLRFDAVSGVPKITSFQLYVNIGTPQGDYIPTLKVWLGGDFTGLIETTTHTSGYPSNQDNRVTVHYTKPACQTEQDWDLDLDGDGTKGEGTDSLVLADLTPNIKTTVSALSLEGVHVYGSSQENYVEGEGPYYGVGDDVFTFRTRILSMQSQSIKNLVLYIPVPRKGQAPTGSAAVNEWDATLLALEGTVTGKWGTDEGEYQLWYSTKPAPAMQELQGFQDVEGSYIQYNPASPPDWSEVTMLKLKASGLPALTSDDLGLTFQNKGLPAKNSLTNHMETYYRYEIDRGDGKGPVTTFGPTASVKFILPYMSVEGKAYLDRDYDKDMDLNGNDQPIAGLKVALYSDKDDKVDEATTAEDGSFVLVPQVEGWYYLQVDPNALSGRKLLSQGSGSDVDPDTGKSGVFLVGKDGVTGKKVGAFEKVDFTLHTDAAYSQPLSDDGVVDLNVNEKTAVYVRVSPDYAPQTAGIQPAVKLSASGNVSAAIANNVITLDGIRVTPANGPVTVTATLSDAAGGVVIHTFRVRVLPPQVVAKFEDNLNFYTDVLYSKDELAGGISLQNRFYDGEDLLPGGLQAVNVYRYCSDGSLDETDSKAWGEMTQTKTFSESQIGKYALVYKGVDVYGRPVVDQDRSSPVKRTVYVHGYPYLTEKSPIQSRVGSGYDPMREQNGTGYITATHEHVYTNSDNTVELRKDETFTADPAKGDITLRGYYAYAKDGSEFDSALGKFKPIDLATAVLQGSTPTEPGAYEAFYSVRMGTRQAVLTLHRTVYLHGSPTLYVPSVVSILPEKNADGTPKGGVMDLDYAAKQIWKDRLLDMRELRHVREDGTVAVYDRAMTKFYLQNGVQYEVSGAGGNIGGWSVIAAPRETATTVGGYGGKTANVFLKSDSLQVLQNTPGTYEVTLVFQDTIDGMGTAPVGADPEDWNVHWDALYQKGGIGYTEMKVKVLVASDNAKPVLPSQDQVITNFVLGDSVWFSRLTDLDDKNLDEIKTQYDASAAAELQNRLDAHQVVKLEYENWIRYYQAEPSELESPVSSGSCLEKRTGEELLYMLNQGIRYKTHDVDIHALAPSAGSHLQEAKYEALHQAAVTLLWKSVRLTKLRVPVVGQDRDQVYLNPTNDQLLDILAENKPGALEATFSVNDVKITPDGTVLDQGTLDDAASADQVSGYGYRLTLDTQETVTETYKIYLHSDLKFERPGGEPLVTYGLHVPSALSHTSMPINAYFTGAKALQKVSFPAACANPDIGIAGTSIDMDYTYTHPIEVTLPTLRDRTVTYHGRAFVNDDVKLLYQGTDSLPANVYSLTGSTVDIAAQFAAKVDKWTGLPPDDALDGTSADYPPVKGKPGAAGVEASTGAEYKTGQEASLKIYQASQLLYDSTDPGAGTGELSSRAPGAYVLSYVAEDYGTDANHPYHNGPNRQSATVSYIFDSHVALTFGSNVQQDAGSTGYTMKALQTATADELKAMLGAKASVIYGDSPDLSPSDVAVEYKMVMEGGTVKAIEVTAEARNGNQTEAVVDIILLKPPVILIRMTDEKGVPVASPVTIRNAVIGMPYTVPAPYLEGYVPIGETMKSIPSVLEGENEVTFTYRAAEEGERLVDYKVVYRLEDGTVLMELAASGLAGSEVAHTAQEYFFKDGERYALGSEESAAKGITLSDSGENRMEFLYVPDPVSAQVQYTVQYVYDDGGSTAVAESHSMVGTVGETVRADAPVSFSRNGYQYTLKPGEQNFKSMKLESLASKNVIIFRYSRSAIPGGSGGGTTEVEYYAVVFVPGPYGTLEGEGELRAQLGDKVDQVPAVRPAEGYRFLGWYRKYKNELTDPLGQTVTGNLTFYAAYSGPDGETVGGNPSLNKEDHIAYLFGDAKGTFRADAPMTRAEVAAMFARLLQEPMPPDYSAPSSFKDIDPRAWYAKSVSYLEQFGILKGYEDGTYGPNKSITRAEFVAITSRFTRLTLTDKQQFPDVPPGHWAAIHIYSAKVQGWIGGYPDGTFRPGSAITRAEVTRIINGLLDRSGDQAYIDTQEGLKQFPDLERSHWAYYDIMEAANAHKHTRKDGKEQWVSVE